MRDRTDCPLCGKLNNDDWPLNINGDIVKGGCQECWEKQCDEHFQEYKRIVEGHLKMFRVFFDILKETGPKDDQHKSEPNTGS